MATSFEEYIIDQEFDEIDMEEILKQSFGSSFISELELEKLKRMYA